MLPSIKQTLGKNIKMNFSIFFSKQARRPEGLFGRIVMRIVFDQGNAFLNTFVSDLMSVQTDDCIIEIGSGTGKLIYKMAQKIDKGLIEGIDFSSAMVSVARKINKNDIAKGRVKILEGDFNNVPYEKEKYSKACSVNTLYFWPSPMHTAKKIADILKPDGKLILAFEDIEQLKQRKLIQDVFHLYSKDEVRDLLINAGFSNNVSIVSRKKGKSIFHCAVAIK
jgi:ubiquinone/menaquinone biosynthesis C-methylase UbiE